MKIPLVSAAVITILSACNNETLAPSGFAVFEKYEQEISNNNEIDCKALVGAEGFVPRNRHDVEHHGASETLKASFFDYLVATDKPVETFSSCATEIESARKTMCREATQTILDTKKQNFKLRSEGASYSVGYSFPLAFDVFCSDEIGVANKDGKETHKQTFGELGLSRNE